LNAHSLKARSRAVRIKLFTARVLSFLPSTRVLDWGQK